MKSNENGVFRFEWNENINSLTTLVAATPDRLMMGNTYFNKDDLPIQLVLTKTTLFNVSVTVFDADGHPVEDATVSCKSSRALTTTPSYWFLPREKSDSQGKLTFQWAEEDQLDMIYAIKPGTGIAIVAAKTNDRLNSEHKYELRMSKPKTVKFRIVNEMNEPLKNFRIFAIPETEALSIPILECLTYTDDEGMAPFEWIPTEGFRRIRFSISQELTEEQKRAPAIAMYGWTDRFYPLDKIPEEIHLVMPRLARVVGTVKRNDGTPLHGVVDIHVAAQRMVGQVSPTGRTVFLRKLGK